MAGWLHGVFVVDWLFVFPLCGFSLSLFCNYSQTKHQAPSQAEVGVPVMVTKECTCRCSDSILGRTNTNI